MGRRESTNESFISESLEKNIKFYILTLIKSFNEHILTVSFHAMSSKNEQHKITLESEMFNMNFKVTQKSTYCLNCVTIYLIQIYLRISVILPGIQNGLKIKFQLDNIHHVLHIKYYINMSQKPHMTF